MVAIPLYRLRISSWSLRARLLAGLIALLAAVCLVVGITTEIFLHRYLIGQLDNQLAAAAGRATEAAQHPLGGPTHAGPPPVDPRHLPGPGQSIGTLVVHISDGQIDRSVIVDGSQSGTTAMPAAARAELLKLPVDGNAHTMHLGSLGSYRVVARGVGSGTVMVTGLPEHDISATLVRLAITIAGVAGTALLLAAVAGAIIVRITLRPLQRVGATAARVAELPLDRGEVALSVRVPDQDIDSRTEVGQVGVAINRMLGHVAAALAARHASETRVRQFVADASHELRTPLSAIRGYAELTRRSRDNVPPDIAHAMRRVESESTRMTALVEDLLLLARLDSGRPLEREPVDLTPLVIDAVSDAHIAGPDHSWSLDLPERPFVVLGDAARLHQAVANLLANARAHTPAGTTVTTGLSRIDARQVALSVVDDGPGIPPALLPEVFERFARGDTSRSRAAGSTGLGLSIVAAVVEAHRGLVEVTSRPGRTQFTITLPLAAWDRAGSQAGDSDRTGAVQV